MATVVYNNNPRQPPPISANRRRANPAFEEFSATTPSLISSYCDNSTMVSTDDDLSPPPTLEEMLARLDAEAEAEEEEEESRYECRYQGLGGPYARNISHNSHRMSSVNNSEILRAARNALNQYPRFSLDGRDALHRPSVDFDSNPLLLHGGQRPGVNLPRKSFINLENQCQHSPSGNAQGFKKAGLLARLMGLETMPVSTPNKVTVPKSSAKGSQNTQAKSNDRRFVQAQQYSKGNSKQSRLGFEQHRQSSDICDQIREDTGWLSLAEKTTTRKTAGPMQFSSPSCNQSEKQQRSSLMKAPELMKYSINMKEKKSRRTCKHGVHY